MMHDEEDCVRRNVEGGVFFSPDETNLELEADQAALVVKDGFIGVYVRTTPEHEPYEPCIEVQFLVSVMALVMKYRRFFDACLSWFNSRMELHGGVEEVLRDCSNGDRGDFPEFFRND